MDPLTNAELQGYVKKYQDYVKTGSGLLPDKCSKKYFDKLVSQLGLEGSMYKGWPLCQISIHEELDKDMEGDRDAKSEPSIYSLLWEVLENETFWQPCTPTRIRLCRTWNFPTVEPGFITQQIRQPSLVPPRQPEYRILLVIARSFKRDRSRKYHDYRPNLVLGALLKIAFWCKQRSCLPRVRVDVVRPGTITELERALKRHKRRPYDIIHLDMHGRIGWKPSPGETLPPMTATPYLRFAKRYNEELSPFRDADRAHAELMKPNDSLEDIEVAQVASLLQKYSITSVALSACLSSYAQCDMLGNMCHVFLSHGISHVSAMSFEVSANTARIYYAAFYEALLVNGESFLSAAAVGREALRASPGQTANAMVPTNYHHAARVSANDWPKHRVRVTWLLPAVAICLRLGAAVLGIASTWLPLYIQAGGRFRGSTVLLGGLALAGMVWYGSIRWVRRLQCPLWLWRPLPARIFHPCENLTRLSEHIEIEHLVLEDRLKSGALYLHGSHAKGALGEVVERLARVWVCTGFVDSVDIISASVFMSRLSRMHWWLRLWMTRHEKDFVDNDLGQRRLVVITDFDGLYDVYIRRSITASERKIAGAGSAEMKHALLRMTEFVSRYYQVSTPESDTEEESLADSETNTDDEDSDGGMVIGKTYLIITGSYNGHEWGKVDWFNSKISKTVGRAKPHLHNF